MPAISNEFKLSYIWKLLPGLETRYLRKHLITLRKYNSWGAIEFPEKNPPCLPPLHQLPTCLEFKMATSKQTVRSYKHKFIFIHFVNLIGCEDPLSFKSNLTTFIFELSPNVKNPKKICKKPIRYRVWQKCMVESGSSTRRLILIFNWLLLNLFLLLQYSLGFDL